MRCSSCGQINPANSAFCNSCGTRLISALFGSSTGYDIPPASLNDYVGRQAELAELSGALDQAVTHFEDGLKFCRKGYRPELPWTYCDCADSLVERNGPGDRGRATSLLNESLAISTELGMRPLMERVQSRLEVIASSPRTTPTYPEALPNGK